MARGRAYAKIGDSKLAMEDCDKSISLDPNYSQAYRLRGDIYLTMGSIPSSEADITKADWLDNQQEGQVD